MANPYYVDPMGGYGPAVAQGLSGLGSGLGNQDAMERQQQAQQAQQAAMQQELMQAYQSQDPNQVAQVMFKYPEASKMFDQAIGFRDQATANNMVTSARDILSNPDRAEQILQSRIAMVEARGGDATETREALEEYRTDPQGFIRSAEMVLASKDPEAFEAYRVSKAPADMTANIQDYEYYQELKQTNPEAAEQFARQVGITKDEKPELKPTTAMQNLEQWRSMPEGPEKDAFAKMIGVDPKKSYADIRKDVEKAESVRGEIVNATTTINLADTLLNNEDYMNAITGVRGATPFSIPGSTGFDAMVAFDQLKNSLTLDNLSKMSGVLSDSDIKILQSAGAGLEPGMSKGAMQRRLKQIKSVLMSKTRSQRKKLKQLGLDVDAMTKEPEKQEGPVNWSDL